LTPAARARRPSVEQSHEENHARSTRADRRGTRAGARAARGRGSDARRRSEGSGAARGRRVSPRAAGATAHELSRVGLLATLLGETLGRLAERMRRETVSPGSAVVNEGEDGDRFYIVLSGMFTVSQATRGAQSVLR